MANSVQRAEVFCVTMRKVLLATAESQEEALLFLIAGVGSYITSVSNEGKALEVVDMFCELLKDTANEIHKEDNNV